MANSPRSHAIERARGLLLPLRCCPVPAAPSGVTAGPGAGSGEVALEWDAPSSGVASWRVYRRWGQEGQYLVYGQTTPAAAIFYPAGRIGFIDIEALMEQSYRVAAVSTHGVEGPMSVEVTGGP